MKSFLIIAAIIGVACASRRYQSDYGRKALASLALGQGAHGLELGIAGVGALAGLESNQGGRLDLEAPGAGRGYAAPQAIGAQAFGGYGAGYAAPASYGYNTLAIPQSYGAGYGNQGLRLRPLPAAVTAGRVKAVGALGKTSVNRLSDAYGNDIASLDYAGFDGIVSSDYAVQTGRRY